MLRNAETSRRTTSVARKSNTRGRGVRVLFLLAIVLGSAAQLAPSVQASPQNEITNARFYFTVKAPSQLCVGKSDVVTVRPQFDMSGTSDDGQPFSLKERIFTGVSVAAEILDTSVATVSPASAKSGALPRSLFGGHGTSDFGLSANFGSLTFSVKGVKAGSTALILTAQAPVPAGSNRTMYFGPSGMPPSIGIKVLPCKYKISMNMRVFGSMDNIAETMTYKLKGNISGDGTLTGTADVSWKTQQVTSCFTTYQVVPPSTATLKGTMSEDGNTLTVRVHFGSATLTNSVNFVCGYGASATKVVNFAPPDLTFSLPSSGESVTQPVTMSLGGQLVLNGTATLTATEAK